MKNGAAVENFATRPVESSGATAPPTAMALAP